MNSRCTLKKTEPLRYKQSLENFAKKIGIARFLQTRAFAWSSCTKVRYCFTERWAAGFPSPRISFNKAQIFVCSNRLFVVDMAGVEQGSVSNEEFMEEVTRYECVYHRNSKDFKDRNKKNRWEIGDQIPQHKNSVWSLFEATENATSWIGARCSAKRISKPGMAQSTYCTQTIKQKFEIKVAS